MSDNVASTPAVDVRNLSFRYAGAERWVLSHVSFAAAAGETLLILGPSGCGKSTLALCLNGLIPNEIEGELLGEVLIWGQPAASMWGSGGTETSEVSTRGEATLTPAESSEHTAPVGEVFQDPETQMVMPRLDEEVAFGLENLGLPPEEMPARITSALTMVGLQARAREWVDALSGGQKQRLALAAVLALQPSVLVLDEPTANLDPMATVEFFQTLSRLKETLGVTIILIEHRLDVALPLVDRVVAMNSNGQVMAQGTPQEVFTSHSAELQAEGIWLPMTCRLTQALAAIGLPIPGCPLTLDEAEASLRMWTATNPSSPRMWSATSPDVAATTEKSIWSATTPSSHSNSVAVAISDLSFSYPGSPPALRHVNLNIERGRFFALVGANGSGKTTLAKHLVGLLRPASGAVSLLGSDTRRQSSWDMARQVGYVFQNPEHQFVTERVSDELAYSLRGRWDAPEIARRVSSLLHTFGLEGYADANPFSLSQGQKRRLSVATMVALDQPILILDEPTFGQDQQSTTALMANLRQLNEAGTTIVFITHDMQLVAEYASEVAVMQDGAIIFQGALHDLFARPDIMERASLVLPPLAELSRRLGLPPLLTVQEWVAAADVPELHHPV